MRRAAIASAAALLAAAVPALAPAAAWGAGADPLLDSQWGLFLARVPEAWATAADGAPVTVAVVDSGVDAAQPDLDGAIGPGADFVDGAGGDPLGHGTMVAGVIAARANELGGAGVCPGCRVLPVRVVDASGHGSGHAVAAGIRWAADAGVRVINLSLELDGADAEVADAVAYAEGRGVLVVAAAGNDGAGAVTYPGGYPGVVSVAGVEQARTLYGWSNRGDWVTLAAPGCAVSTLPGDAFGEFCGTSAAAAYVSGVAGLALSVRPELSPADLRGALLATAAQLDGARLVDAAALLAALRPPPAPERGTSRRTAAAVPAAAPKPKPAARRAAKPKPRTKATPAAKARRLAEAKAAPRRRHPARPRYARRAQEQPKKAHAKGARRWSKKVVRHPTSR